MVLFSQNKHSGFTLMEVLIALVILAIAFTSIFMSISHNARALLYLQNKTAANWVGLNVIAAAQLGMLAKDTEMEGTTNMLNRNWYWHAEKITTPDPYVAQLNVEVGLADNKKPVLHLIGYLRNE